MINMWTSWTIKAIHLNIMAQIGTANTKSIEEIGKFLFRVLRKVSKRCISSPFYDILLAEFAPTLACHGISTDYLRDFRKKYFCNPNTNNVV